MLWELLRYPSEDAQAQVYWRRRVSVLAVVAVVALLMLVLLFRGGGQDSVTPTAAERPGTAAPSAPATPGVPSGSAAPGSPTPSGSGSPSATPSASANPDASVPPAAAPPDPATTCAAGSMALRIASDAPSYAPGVSPLLRLSVVDIGTQPCSVDLGTTGTTLTALSAGKPVWSSSACTDKAARPVQLTPAAAQMLQLRWDRTRNVGSCGSPEALPAGPYEIVARVGNSAVYGGSLVLS